MSEHILHPGDLPVPVKIYVERRYNSRVSLASKYIIIRLPAHLSGDEKNRRVQEHIEWARQQLMKKDHYPQASRTTGDYHQKTLRLCDTDYRIELFGTDAARNKLNYRHDQVIRIFLQNSLPETVATAEVRRLLIRFAERYYTPHITQRTHHFNHHFFREPIEQVRLNHTVSKWGSCSAKRRIMFSTKLLLLPLPVIDYVIVHELAHLKEMNHSQKFWNEVARAMPDYKKWDRWLTCHGGEFHF